MLRSCADMAGRRALYLAALFGCGIFYIAYGQWLAWFLLVTVVILPWFSLALSLPAMLSFRVCPAGEEILEMGDDAELWLLGSCVLPMPPFRGRLMLRRHLSGQLLRYQEDAEPITSHCGGITVTAQKVRIYDYLGLFSMPVWKTEEKRLLVRPKPLPVALPEDLHRYISLRWKPKYGGGFAENHELRLYRPGDNLNQVHWKLTAKTGTLIFREAVEPVQGQVLLTMDLTGTAEELDRKFGRLLWLGQTLLAREIPFALRALTGEGPLTFSVTDTAALQKDIDTLLCCSAAREGSLQEQGSLAAWHCHIGGAPDEP